MNTKSVLRGRDMKQGYSVKFFEKTFENEVSKQAYLDACKWLATNVYCSEGYSEYITVKIKKQQQKKSDTTYKFTVELFYMIDFESAKSVFCNNCKLSVNTFFGNDAPCQTCRVTPLIKKLDHDTYNMVEGLAKDFKEREKNQ